MSNVVNLFKTEELTWNQTLSLELRLSQIELLVERHNLSDADLEKLESEVISINNSLRKSIELGAQKVRSIL